MAQQAAIKSKDLPDWQATLAERTTAAQTQQRQATRSTALAAKTFETLSTAEKGKLLKAVAVQMGLIQDSDDV